MEREERARAAILEKAYQLGGEALVDPVPELWNEDSLDSRIDTMKAHFEEILETLEKEYESLVSEPVSSELEMKILNEMQKGFESLMDTQPGYIVEKQEKRKNPGIRSEVEAEMKKIMEKTFEALLEKRLGKQNQNQDRKGIWIEKDEALNLVDEVFHEIKEDHKS